MNNIPDIDNLTNLTDVNPALGLPRYNINPNYTMIFLINTIVLSLVLKNYNERILKILNIQNKRLARLFSTEFLLDMLHWGNLFFLAYNLIIPFIPEPTLV